MSEQDDLAKIATMTVDLAAIKPNQTPMELALRLPSTIRIAEALELTCPQLAREALGVYTQTITDTLEAYMHNWSHHLGCEVTDFPGSQVTRGVSNAGKALCAYLKANAN